MPEFSYRDLLPIGEDKTEYRLISTEGVSTFTAEGMEFLKVSPEAIENLTAEAIHDINHYLRTEHLQQLSNIINDPEASPNDRFVALDLMKNANIAAGGILPMCQDTGTALVMGKKGQRVLTSVQDEQSISRGVYDAYTSLNLRYSQMAPVATTSRHKLRFTLIPTIQMNTTSSSLQRVAAVPTSLISIKRQKRFLIQSH